MRLKLDENLPAELADDLRALGHSVDSVASEGLAGEADLTVVRAARRAKRALLTLDKGLGDVRRFPPDTYAGVVVFRLSRSGREHTRRAVLSAMPRIDRLRPLAGRLVMVTESTVRVRR